MSKTNLLPAEAVAVAVATRDERAAALADARASVKRILSEWHAGIDTAAAQEKSAAEDEIDRMTILLAAAERNVTRTRKAMQDAPTPEKVLRELASGVVFEVTEASAFAATISTGAYDTGRRRDVQCTSDTQIRDGKRGIEAEITFTAHPASAQSKWTLPRIEEQIKATVLALDSNDCAGLGPISVEVLGSQLIEDGVHVPLTRERVSVAGGRHDGLVARDAVAVRVRVTTADGVSPTQSKATSRRGVDPRDRDELDGHPGSVE